MEAQIPTKKEVKIKGVEIDVNVDWYNDGSHVRDRTGTSNDCRHQVHASVKTLPLVVLFL